MSPLRFSYRTICQGLLLLVIASSGCTSDNSIARMPAVDGSTSVAGAEAAAALSDSSLEILRLKAIFDQQLTNLPAGHPALPFLGSAATNLQTTAELLGQFKPQRFRRPRADEPGDADSQIATVETGQGAGDYSSMVVNDLFTQSKFAMYVNCCVTTGPILGTVIEFKAIEGTLNKNRRSGALKHFTRVAGRTGPADMQWAWSFNPSGASSFSLDDGGPSPGDAFPGHTTLQIRPDGSGQGTAVRADGTSGTFTWP